MLYNFKLPCTLAVDTNTVVVPRRKDADAFTYQRLSPEKVNNDDLYGIFIL